MLRISRLLAFACLCLFSLCVAAQGQLREEVLKAGAKANMDARLFTPAGSGPWPAVLLLHTSAGLEPADHDYARRLAGEGFVVLVPAFLDAYLIRQQTRRFAFTTHAEAIFADFEASIAMLRGLPAVDGKRVGAVGFSNGGYFALWLAAAGKVQAGVSYYGAVTGSGTDIPLKRFRDTFTRDSAPVLILHGRADDTVPFYKATELGRFLAEIGAPHRMRIYDDTGHRFERQAGEGNVAAAQDAWQRTLALLRAM